MLPILQSCDITTKPRGVLWPSNIPCMQQQIGKKVVPQKGFIRNILSKIIRGNTKPPARAREFKTHALSRRGRLTQTVR